jgi:hypothetical protein
LRGGFEGSCGFGCGFVDYVGIEEMMLCGVAVEFIYDQGW